MEETPERKENGPENQNLLTNPAQAIQAMAELEGPAWLAQQEAVAERVIGHNLTEWEKIEKVAHDTITGALERLRTLDKQAGDEVHKIYTVYGSSGIHRYYVYSDGTVKFSATHADYARPEETGAVLQKARELGFGIFS